MKNIVLKDNHINNYTTIIWDWNGTLLNDVDASIATINELLSKRELPTLTKEHYLDVFRFPVIEYYHDLGFDFEKEVWEDVVIEFMHSYHTKEQSFSLFSNAKDTLDYFKTKGYKQYILSAMRTESITHMLETYNITHFFDGIYGLDNQYANGKVDLGRQFTLKENINTSECLMIGDTCHDAEVAETIGIDCCLISNGHTSYQRLSETGHSVLRDVKALRNKF